MIKRDSMFKISQSTWRDVELLHSKRLCLQDFLETWHKDTVYTQRLCNLWRILKSWKLCFDLIIISSLSAVDSSCGTTFSKCFNNPLFCIALYGSCTGTWLRPSNCFRWYWDWTFAHGLNKVFVHCWPDGGVLQQSYTFQWWPAACVNEVVWAAEKWAWIWQPSICSPQYRSALCWNKVPMVFTSHTVSHLRESSLELRTTVDLARKLVDNG